jgi:hypothetical protein
MRRVTTGQRDHVPMDGSNHVDLLSVRQRIDVAESGRILERRSGDPGMDGSAGKRQPGLLSRMGRGQLEIGSG